ncbi:MAG: ribosome biogenesis GTPase Der [Candidatus Kerfeldbacteria bacterium]
MKKNLPRVALVGRINAGKSTLFNTLTETTKAIVSPVPGTTRDLNLSDISWRDKSFTLIDTGGLDAAYLGEIEGYVQKKAYETIMDSDLILYVIDGKQEITAEDRKIARFLKKSKKKVILAINKVDGPRIKKNVSPDIFKLGFKVIAYCSAASGVGTGDLLDTLIKHVPLKKLVERQIDLRLSIIGKTNVGKSSILNSLLGDDRAIVTPVPHTTREPQDTEIKYKGKNILIVDTAGLRKKRKLSDDIEKKSVLRTYEAIKSSHISLFVVDADQPLSSQDQNIAELALESKNGVIIVVNKWDLIKDKDPATINKFTKYYDRFLPWMDWAPYIFTSVKEKKRIHKLLQLALDIQAEREKEIPEEELKNIVKRTYRKKAKASRGKKSTEPITMQQSGINPPFFELLVYKPHLIHQAYLNLLKNKIREKYGFKGTPIVINMKKVK